MSQEFDELVKDSMARFTDGVRAPEGLAARARHQVRRRRVRTTWLAGGTAAAAAAAVLIGTLSAGSAPASKTTATGKTTGTATIQTTAVVVSEVEHALARTQTGHPIAFTREVSHGTKLFVLIPHGKPVEVSGAMLTWSRGSSQHVEVVTSSGRLALGMRTELRAGKSVQTTIAYPQRVWWRGTYAAPAAANPKLGCALGDLDRTPGQWAREVRKLLSCGAKVAGYQRVDGVKAIKLKLSSSYMRACVAANDHSPCMPQPVGWTGTLWANAATYLPVRLASHGSHYSFRIDFRWLAPTEANLAMLHQQIPAGFKHV